MADGPSARNWVISFGPFRVDKMRRLLEQNGEPVHIGSRAFDILAHLLERPGQVVSHQALLDAAWPGLSVEDGNLRFQMAMLRKALGSEQKWIINVPGRGYCFSALTSRHDNPDPTEAPAQPAPEKPASPPTPAALVGRDEVVAKISGLVRAHRVVSIVGAGGIGKTSVAAVVTGQLRNVFGDRVCFVALGYVEDPGRVADSLAVALRLPVRSEDTVGDIMGALKSQRMLVVVDGCEQQIDAAAILIDKIVAATTEINFLVTSREALRIEAERVFQLEALPFPPVDRDLSAEEVLSYPAARLFVDRADAPKDALSSDREMALVARICSELDGLPLAIEMAASQAQVSSFNGLAQMLEDGLSLTWPGRRTAPARHQTLGAMLEWSYRLLPEEEKSALRSLSIFSGQFNLEAASAVAIDAQLALAELVSKSLISVTRQDKETGYRLLDTTRIYARQKLAEVGELDAVRRRHANFYLQALKAQYEVEKNLPALDVRHESIEDVRAAIAWAFQSEPALAVRLVTASIPLFESLGLFHEALVCATNALTLADRLGEQAETEYLLRARARLSAR